MSQTSTQPCETDQLRADIYLLLAALFRASPTPQLLDFLQNLDIEAQDQTDMAKCWRQLQVAAAEYTEEELEDEYFSLFIGVGCGEILPYGSWFITGSLMDKPLALLRQDLMQLGFERQDDVKEPEDHVAALFEVMATLITEAPSFRQLSFYQRHLSSWITRFCHNLAKAHSAKFYRVVALLTLTFMQHEANEFEQLSLLIPTNCPGTDSNQPIETEPEQNITNKIN